MRDFIKLYFLEIDQDENEPLATFCELSKKGYQALDRGELSELHLDFYTPWVEPVTLATALAALLVTGEVPSESPTAAMDGRRFYNIRVKTFDGTAEVCELTDLGYIGYQDGHLEGTQHHYTAWVDWAPLRVQLDRIGVVGNMERGAATWAYVPKEGTAANE